MQHSLCTLCFSNFGLRYEAEQLVGISQIDLCPNCLQIGGRPLDRASAEALMHKFFVQGSVPPEAGGPAPVYEFNAHRYPGEVGFATELDSDLRRLSDFLGVGLFHYGLPLWRIGYTEHYQALRGVDGVAIQGAERKKLWEEILHRCSIGTIGPGSHIFRIRAADTLPAALPSQFDTPPPTLATGGRYETPELPVFYGADDIETCLHESRITLADWIALATFTPTKPLRLVDLAGNIDGSSVRTPFERVDILMMKLAFVGRKDYDLCRELAAEIHRLGFDGFYFMSYFAQAHKKSLRNIALFGHPVLVGKLQLISVNRLRLSSVAYEYAFGPSNDTNVPIDLAALKTIIEKMTQGPEAYDSANKELGALLSRKSNGPR
jgi:hypothetical protein